MAGLLAPDHPFLRLPSFPVACWRTVPVTVAGAAAESHCVPFSIQNVSPYPENQRDSIRGLVYTVPLELSTTKETRAPQRPHLHFHAEHSIVTEYGSGSAGENGSGCKSRAVPPLYAHQAPPLLPLRMFTFLGRRRFRRVSQKTCLYISCLLAWKRAWTEFQYGAVLLSYWFFATNSGRIAVMAMRPFLFFQR